MARGGGQFFKIRMKPIGEEEGREITVPEEIVALTEE